MKALSNLIHHTSQSIKEEVVNLLMVTSEEFDEPGQLMEVQRVN